MFSRPWVETMSSASHTETHKRMKPGIKVGDERRGIKKVKFTRSVIMLAEEC